jgi:hypothetical protein
MAILFAVLAVVPDPFSFGASAVNPALSPYLFASYVK